MTYDELCAYLLKHPGAIKEHPLGADILAFKVNDKIFALLALQKKPIELTLKCKAENQTHYRKLFPAMVCGSVSNQTCWITLPLDAGLPLFALLDIIDESYEIVLKSLKKSIRDRLQMDRV
jgi:predicted DNA-binding protein (MmcQ/YjbR family)